MRAVFKKFGLGVGVVLLGSLALSLRSEAGDMRANYAPIGGETTVPYGWLDFCGRRPNECNVPILPAVDVRLTATTQQILDQVNREVNAYIKPVSNLDHWGTIIDHWDYPIDGRGDCKIYALFKRKLLMEAGFPRQALLMTIVRDHNDQGHAILTVKTDKGEFILDNLTNDIKIWDATGYRFVKRQAQENPNVWLAIAAAAKTAAFRGSDLNIGLR
ncbi:MAG: transglutaminase-like cysteine peptidase [Beijerinckiaceae bacterium]